LEETDVLGIDVSMGKSNCVVYHRDRCVRSFVFSHTQTGFKALDNAVKQAVNPVVYFESTGIYARPVRAFCEHHSIPYVELNPLSLHLEMGTLRRLKTDHADAHKIAKYGITHPQPLTHMFTPTYQKIRELTRFYIHIEKDISEKRMFLDNALQQTFPEIEQFF